MVRHTACVSVRHVREFCQSKYTYLQISLSGSQTILVNFRTKRHGNIIPTGTPLTSMTAGYASAKCNVLSCDGPWGVDDTSRW